MRKTGVAEPEAEREQRHVATSGVEAVADVSALDRIIDRKMAPRCGGGGVFVDRSTIDISGILFDEDQARSWLLAHDNPPLAFPVFVSGNGAGA